MTTIVVAALGLCLFHFLYEGVVAPSIRFWIRLRLYRLRDELRSLKARHQDRISDEVFRYLDSSISSSITVMNRLSPSAMVRVEEHVRRDEDFRRKVSRRRKVVQRCDVAEVKNVYRRAIWLTGSALAVNSGGWIPYIIPVVISLAAFEKISAAVKTVTFVQENEISMVLPQPRGATA